MEELNCSDETVVEDLNKALDVGFNNVDSIIDTLAKVNKVREGYIDYPYP